MTFSIGGICERTGQIGCAVTTSSMAVGARVGRALPGRGVVFSQARTDPTLHALGLQSLQTDLDPNKALEAMRAAAVQPQWRQLGVLSADGRAAVHTGESCLDYSGARIGLRCLAIGNFLSNEGVLEAMTTTFESDPERALANRLIEALKSGAQAGGEQDPLRSAALLVFAEDSFAHIDLRSDDSTDPLGELDRLEFEFQSKADAYRLRVLDPENAPSSHDIEHQS